MSFFVGLFGGNKSQATQQAAAAGMNVQTSVQGKPIPLVYGTTRISPNIIWYGDFNAVQQKSSSSSGGKGGVGGGGGGKGGGGGSGYNYYTSWIAALCEGQVNATGTVWVDKNITSLSTLGFSFFSGYSGQPAWGYLETNHPDEALGYSDTSYLAASNYSLGTSPQLPNHNFEIAGLFSNVFSGIPDADPSLVISDILTNPVHGVGFPSSRLASLAVYQAYCLANGLWISPYYDSQQQTSQMLDDITTATNSAVVWSSGQLQIIPYGDQNITANGYTYTAPSAPIYSLSNDDFMDPQKNSVTGGSGGSSDNSTDPVVIVRKRPSDANNSVTLEYLDRTNSYNTAIVQATDSAMINIYGLRPASVTTTHLFCDANAAQLSAQLQLQRQAIRNVYSFTLDQRYIALDPMDIVSISDSYLGISNQWVRITEIVENDDLTLSITAEEYLDGTGNAAINSFQTGSGFEANYAIDPGQVNTPVIFEPPAELEEALQIWIGVSGGSLWGGCDVYISNDGTTYKNVGRITGENRTGLLNIPLPLANVSNFATSLDTINTLVVDMTQSKGQLPPVSVADANALASLCYVDGELIAYQNSTLITGYEYALAVLYRGCYGSSISYHLAGTQFLRLDGSQFQLPYTQDFIGKTVYFKFANFNIYGGGLQLLSDVSPYAYTIQGTAYSSPLPDVTNVRVAYNNNIAQLFWDEVSDFRQTLYEIRQGTSFLSGLVLGRVAHPPFNTQGNGTYWIAAYAQPVPGLQVYSKDPQEVIITGSQIVTNVIANYDEAATGWTGTLGGTAALSAGIIHTSGVGNILTISDFLGITDLLNLGGVGNGTYEIPTGHEINIGRVAACSILINWFGYGQKTTDNMLSIADFLNYADILDSISNALVDIYPEIALSQDGTTWGSWQKYSAGYYSAMKFKARMQIQTQDSSIVAYLSAFTFAVDVPDRIDHYNNISLSSLGVTLSFTPDGSSTAAPFNGGNGGSSLPNVQVTILNAQAGDVAIVSGLTLSSVTVIVKNAGTGVARNVNILAQGY